MLGAGGVLEAAYALTGSVPAGTYSLQLSVGMQPSGVHAELLYRSSGSDRSLVAWDSPAAAATASVAALAATCDDELVLRVTNGSGTSIAIDPPGSPIMIP
jgi:hypothetical protein